MKDSEREGKGKPQKLLKPPLPTTVGSGGFGSFSGFLQE